MPHQASISFENVDYLLEKNVECICFFKLDNIVNIIKCLLEYQQTLENIKQHPLAQNLHISLLITDDKHIQKLNKQYRNKDESTDVISFPAFELNPNYNIAQLLKEGINWPSLRRHKEKEERQLHLGDIVISLETCIMQAKKENKKISEEFNFLLVHGILHLFGYDHETNIKDKKEMENLEKILLQQLI